MNKKKILTIETFYGGAHRAFIDGIIRHSFHEFSLLTLPDELWRWRLKTAAFEIASELPPAEQFDLVFVTDLINLTDLKMIMGDKAPPVVLYYHENQHSYPPEKGRAPDFHIRWIDFTNAVAADSILFNSHFQMNSFLNALPGFLREIPESRVKDSGIVTALREKTSVIYPGTESPLPSNSKGNYPLKIVWNHRWEYDKAPGQFLRIMIKLMKMDLPFELILLGESQKFPSSQYDDQLKILAPRIVHRGFLADRSDYFDMLKSADIVISTSNQENFGLSIVEAVQCGCFPLLPNRLAYPEILPEEFHSRCLYWSEKELLYKLSRILTDTIPDTSGLDVQLGGHRWDCRIKEFDQFFSGIERRSEAFK